MRRSKNLLKHEEKEIVELYKEKTPLVDIQEKLNVSKSTIHRITKKHGVARSPGGSRDCSKVRCILPELEIIKKYRDGLSLSKLSKEYKVSVNAIKGMLERNNIKLRTHWECCMGDCNHDLFKTIDTEEKAYWLGVLITDGSVHGNTISLCRAIQDLDHLESFKEFVGSDNKICIYNHKVTGKLISFFSFSSKVMVKDLAKYGVVERKTKKCCKPELLLDLERHFWRGCTDGDGCITTSKGHPVLNFCGSVKLVEEFKDFGCKLLNRSCDSKKISYHKQSNYYRINFNGPQALKILDYFYNPCSCLLSRKFNKYCELKNLVGVKNGVF